VLFCDAGRFGWGRRFLVEFGCVADFDGVVDDCDLDLRYNRCAFWFALSFLGAIWFDSRLCCRRIHQVRFVFSFWFAGDI
jgi:hypothetical protein